MRRLRSLPLAVLLCLQALPLLAAALALPAGGLPGGRITGAFIAIEPASVGSWQALRGFSLLLGRNVPWADLDEETGRMAVAPLVKHLSPVLIAEAGQAGLTDTRREALALALEQAQEAAAGEAALHSAKAMEAMRTALREGRLGSQDLAGLELQLRALSVYGGEAEKDYQELRVLADEQKRFDLARSMERAAKGLGSAPKDDPITGQASQGPSGLTKAVPGQASGKVQTLVPSLPRTAPSPARQGWAKAARWTGYALIGVSALFLFSLVPPLFPALGAVLAYSGLALSAISRFLQTPVGAPQGPPAPRKPAITTGWLKDFRNLYQRAQENIVHHERFEKEVGGGSWSAFKTWVLSALRTALYWVPLALGGMLAGSVLAKLGTWLIPAASAAGAAAAEAGAGAAVSDLSLSFFLSGFVAQALVAEVLLLGVVFNGLQWLASRLPGLKSRAGVIAGALTLAALVPFLLTTFPAALVLPILGIEAVMIWAYASSGSMLLPLVMRGLFTFASLDAARMMAFFTMPAGALAGIPAFWAGASVAGVAFSVFAGVSALRHWKEHRWGFLKAGFKGELARLRDVGRAWREPSADGKPKSFLPILGLGLLWGIITYVVGDMTYWGAHLLDATSEPTPEILKRMLSMPLDIILYNFVIVAALEEWVFRKGVFKPMVERVKKWGWPSAAWFWPAAVLSSIIFSLAHFIDWSALLAHIGVGGGDVAAGITGGSYAWSWGGFLARVTAGMVMALAYARSGVLLVAMVAHFTSNSLESVGMRWGLAPFLAVAAAVMLLQAYRSRASK